METTAAVANVLAHHVKEDVCYTRPKYRDGRKRKGVKVYTCAQESKYLLVTNVPSLSAHLELIKLFEVYGNVVEYKMLDEYPCREFCEAILVKFEKIQNARIAKIKLDDYNFYGGSIHVCYAPEFETIEDLREKLEERRLVVRSKCEKYEKMGFGTLEYDLKSKKFSTRLSSRDSRRGKKINNKSVNEKKKNKVDVKEEKEENPLFDQPKLPENWVKSTTITGDESLDQTVHNIRLQLKSTMPTEIDTQMIKKKKKRVKL